MGLVLPHWQGGILRCSSCPGQHEWPLPGPRASALPLAGGRFSPWKRLPHPAPALSLNRTMRNPCASMVTARLLSACPGPLIPSIQAWRSLL